MDNSYAPSHDDSGFRRDVHALIVPLPAKRTRYDEMARVLMLAPLSLSVTLSATSDGEPVGFFFELEARALPHPLLIERSLSIGIQGVVYGSK
jgi:hypothetical protein